MDTHDESLTSCDSLRRLRERHSRLFMSAIVACLTAGLIVPPAVVAAGFGSVSTSPELVAKYAIVLPDYVPVARFLVLLTAGVCALSTAAVLILERRAWADSRRTSRLYPFLASMVLVFTGGAIWTAWRLMW